MALNLEDLKNFNLFEWMTRQKINRIYFKNGIISFFPKKNSAFCTDLTWSGILPKELFNHFLISRNHEEILFSSYPEVGLRSIIAIHNTDLAVSMPYVSQEKPALGGCRFWNYNSFFEALEDALRLSRAMTYKSAAANLNLGGAKGVVWTISPKNKSFALLKQFALEIESLKGKYIGGEDANCSVSDVEIMSLFTDYLTGRDETKHLKTGGMGSGNPGPITASGIIKGIKACLVFAGMGDYIKDKTILVHGAGSVGIELCRYLSQRGVKKLMISDNNEVMINRAIYECKIGRENVIEPDRALDTECDIYSPCITGGGILNEETIPRLKCKIVCGATNNQLQCLDRDGSALFEKGIIYAPDYVVNSGGLLNVADELNQYGYCRNRVMDEVEKIFNRTLNILMWSRKINIPPHKVADYMAEVRIEKTKLLKGKK